MYSDLFDQLGRGAGRSAAVQEPAEEPSLVSFKAGKMNLTPSPDGSGGYHCIPDTDRGEVRLVRNSNNTDTSDGGGALQWQWYCRRSETVKDVVTVKDAGSTFASIQLPANKQHEADRVYVWTIPAADSAGDSAAVSYKMYWMQDADPAGDEEIVAAVNQYLANPVASNATTGTGTNNATTGGATATTATTNTTNNSNAAASNSQVDALSSILENLGMPQADAAAIGGGATTGTTGTTGTTATGTTSNQLTLADLQGAMAGISQQQPAQNIPGPPLQDVVTSQAIESLLSDAGARQRLMAFLPEDQQTEALLRDNLQSAQVASTLRALTQALMPDDHGDVSGYASMVANFQLDPVDGETALTQGNPVGAFLNCIVKQVEQEKKTEAAAAAETTDDKANDEAAKEQPDDDL